MIEPLLTIIVILTSLVVYLAINNYSMKKDFKQIKPLTMGVSPESKASDMALVFEAMERAVVKSLLYYVHKDIKFGEKSPIQNYYANHYRDLINCLLNNKVVFTDVIDGEEITRPFSSVFIQRVYLLYLAETPESIKMLFFKYYSGYNIEDYNKEKRPKPSVASFITEYINYYLMSRYEENLRAEKILLKQVQHSDLKSPTSKQYKELIDEYDNRCILNLNSHIYSIYGTGVSVPDEFTNHEIKTDTKKTQKKEVTKNEFAVDFNEQRK